MKTVKYLLVVLVGLIVFAGCQKEYSIDSGLSGGLAAGTLKDSLGDCQPIKVYGSYIVDSTLNGNNYVNVKVNITSPGVYRITTDVQNGYYFKDSGYFASAGIQDATLKAVGKPILPTTDIFTVAFNTSRCTFTNKVDTSGSTGGGGNTAVFTPVGTPTCSNANVQGTYTTGVALTSANKVDIQVNVTTPGTYTLTTGPINGITFTGSGTLTATGVQSITLLGTGTPVAAGTTIVPILVGSTGCGFTISVAQGSGPASAVYSLVTTGTTCSNATVQGTYVAGTALGASNTVQLQVNVTTPGVYSLTTATQNGMTFSKAGTFTTTGVQTVTLQGTGTPVSAQATTLPIAAGTSACAFVVTVTGGSTGGGGATAADSAWSFNQGTSFYFGAIDSAYKQVVTGLGTVLTIEGHKYAGVDTLFYIDVLLPGTTVVTGTYSTTSSADMYLDDANSNTIYEVDPTTTGASMNIVITSYNATTKIVTGTFSGTALNKTGAVVPITNGKFTARVSN
jgi:hypothetical protein